MNTPLRCGYLSPIKSCLATLAILLTIGQSANAVILPTGDVTPVYNGTDDPWDIGSVLGVGLTGVGTLEINGGSEVISLLTAIGNDLGADGVLTVTGANSTKATGVLGVAGSGTGELNVEAGGLVDAGAVAMAGGATAISTANITGANSLLDANGIMVVGGAINPFNGDIGPGGDATLTVNSGGAVTIGDAATPLASGLVISVADASGDSGGALTVFSGGQINLGGQALIGQSAGEFGWATLTGEGAYLTTGGNVGVGSAGTGTLDVEAGADVDVGNILNIGQAAGSTGTTTITGSGSTLDTTDDLVVGSSGNGTLNILDGANVRTGILSKIGSEAGSTGEVTVSGAGSHWNADYSFLEPGEVIIINSGLDVGSSGNGTLNIEDGGQVSSGIAVIAAGEGSVSTATVSGAGSQWSIPNRFQVGGGGNGTLTIEDGGVVNSGGESYVGSFEEGNVTVTGAGSQWNHNATLVFGFGGSGTVTVEDGGRFTNDGVTTLGFFPDSDGMLTVTGPGSRWENNDNVSVGLFGSGTLEINGLGVANVRGLGIAADPQGVGVVTVSDAGSQLRISDSLVVGGNAFDGGSGGDGTLNIQNGGRVRLNDTGNFSTLEALDISGDGPMPMDGVTMTVHAGGTVNNDGSAVIGSNAGEYGTAIVTGAGAAWHNGGYLQVGLFGTGSLTIEAGGLVTSTDGTLGELASGTGNATVTGAGSRWDMTGNLDIGPAGSATLTIETGGVVSVVSATTIGANGSIDLTGGRLEFGAMSTPDFAQINGVSGSLAGALDEILHTGTSELSDVIYGSFSNINPAVDVSEVTFSTISNSGLLFGDGVTTASLINNADGTVDVFNIVQMQFGGNGTNNGLINVSAGVLRFGGDLTNNAAIDYLSNTFGPGQLIVDGNFHNESTGTITGEARIDVSGTFTNQGAMNLNEGAVEIRGAFVNDTGGSVLTTEEAITTFFDSVEHNGDPIETAAGSFIEFLGPYSGAGNFTGGGLVRFEDTVDLGNSTASVSFAGGVSLASVATTTLEIGGLLSGEFDQFLVGGNIEIDGDLIVSLTNGFTPSLGDVFEIITAANVLGQFDGVFLPGSGYELVYSATAVQLVATSDLSGDYNNDGVVDAADYTVWRDNEGAPAGTLLNDADGGMIGQAQYDTWVANFGASLPSPSATIPEPAAGLLVVAASTLVRFRRR